MKKVEIKIGTVLAGKVDETNCLINFKAALQQSQPEPYLFALQLYQNSPVLSILNSRPFSKSLIRPDFEISFSWLLDFQEILRYNLNDMVTKEELKKLLKIEEKKAEIARLQKEMSSPSFWRNPQKATAQTQRLAELQETVARFEKATTEKELQTLERQALFSGPDDEKNAILSIHAGAGGVEAQDWAAMLLRMYLRFCQRKGWQVTELERSPGEEAGIKSVTIKVEGYNAYGHLKSEAGVHRLVRISPFDADKARHTSFALVEVIPELEEVPEIKIDEKDLRIDTYRASGAGGQYVNKTSSAVRITHLPTKIVVAVQNERSQLQNKEMALKILKAKLYQKKLEEQERKKAELRGEHLSAGWGNQIRSYILMPYRLVKDHRTGVESKDPEAVLNGELEPFIEGYLRKLTSAKTS